MRAQYIDSNPAILGGKPIIKGTRMSIELIFEKLSLGWKIEDLLQEYPFLSKEQIYGALDYARSFIHNEELIYA